MIRKILFYFRYNFRCLKIRVCYGHQAMVDYQETFKMLSEYIGPNAKEFEEEE